jgi:predicted transcriptional regulator
MNRSFEKMLYDVLMFCKGKIRNSTEILMYCNLNSKNFRKITKESRLLQKVRYAKSTVKSGYITTSKGVEYIKHYRKAYNVMTGQKLKPTIVYRCETCNLILILDKERECQCLMCGANLTAELPDLPLNSGKAT